MTKTIMYKNVNIDVDFINKDDAFYYVVDNQHNVIETYSRLIDAIQYIDLFMD